MAAGYQVREAAVTGLVAWPLSRRPALPVPQFVVGMQSGPGAAASLGGVGGSSAQGPADRGGGDWRARLNAKLAQYRRHRAEQIPKVVSAASACGGGYAGAWGRNRHPCGRCGTPSAGVWRNSRGDTGKGEGAWAGGAASCL